MFRIAPRRRNRLAVAYEMAELIFHMAVRAAGGGQANPLLGLLLNIVQTAIFIIALYVTMTLIGMRSSAFRGDFVLFLMSGVMSYMTYMKSMKAVYGAEGPLSPMMLHAPMNTIVSIGAAAIGALYTQILTTIVILSVYHAAFTPVTIEEPAFAAFMMIAAWIFGVATGLLLLAIRPWAPKFAPILMTIIVRINVFASGKMMVGNAMGFWLLALFDWNPLFHVIDQMRGAIFLNYVPRNSEVAYIFEISAALIVIGLMGEFFTRGRVSRSWLAR